MEKLIVLSESKQKLALVGYLPEVGFVANYTYSNLDFFNNPAQTIPVLWNVGINMKIPIL